MTYTPKKAKAKAFLKSDGTVSDDDLREVLLVRLCPLSCPGEADDSGVHRACENAVARILQSLNTGYRAVT